LVTGPVSLAGVEELRRLVPAAEAAVYLDVAGHSLKFEPVVEESVRWLRFQSEGPGAPPIAESTVEMVEHVRAQVARAINADPDEVMLAENTTIGINIVANGIDWRRGDNVVLSTHAHPGNRIPWYNLAARHGLNLRFVPVMPDEDAFLRDLERAIDSRTRIVSISHVSRRTGVRLPAKSIVSIAHERGVPVLLDGAQAFGAVPVDVRDLACDFYTLSGHKWIMAPQGTGAFFISRHRLEHLWPSFIGSRSQSWMDDEGHMTLHDSARRFEYGTRNSADVAGFGKALEIWETIGWERIFEYVARATDRLKERLLSSPGVVLDTPLPYERSSGIVAFRLDGIGSDALTDWLWRDRRVLASPVEGAGPDGRAVRVTGHAFVLDRDIDQLVAGIEEYQASNGPAG
jgi:selenocysteine lyase/cysteine desulfurase